jgi:Ca2+-binding EF-hand superfamily protein
MIDSVFPKHDKNKSGKLDYLEARSFMKETLKNLDSHTYFSDEKFRLTFKKYDKDNSNELDKTELAALVKDMLNI